MNDEDRWAKVRLIVREECERIAQNILNVLAKHDVPARTGKIGFTGGKWVGIGDEHKAAWAEAYGSVNVETELKRMAAWIVSNPVLAPKSQFGRFINTWLSKQQNISSIRAIPTKSETVKERRCAWCGVPSTGMTNGNEHCLMHAIKAMHEDPPRKIA